MTRRHLDNLARVHQRDPVRHACDHAEIVRDEQNRHAALALQLVEQVENLRLDRDIQRRGRLVGNQHFGFGRERQRDHDALLHAAGKLKWILGQAPRRVGDADALHPFKRACLRRCAACKVVAFEHFDNLLATSEHRVQAGGRFLKDHAHARAAHIAHAVFRQRQHIGSVELDAAGRNPRGLGQQTHDRQRRHRFAAARFTDDGEGFALANFQINTIERAHHPG